MIKWIKNEKNCETYVRYKNVQLAFFSLIYLPKEIV